MMTYSDIFYEVCHVNIYELCLLYLFLIAALHLLFLKWSIELFIRLKNYEVLFQLYIFKNPLLYWTSTISFWQGAASVCLSINPAAFL